MVGWCSMGTFNEWSLRVWSVIDTSQSQFDFCPHVFFWATMIQSHTKCRPFVIGEDGLNTPKWSKNGGKIRKLSNDGTFLKYIIIYHYHYPKLSYIMITDDFLGHAQCKKKTNKTAWLTRSDLSRSSKFLQLQLLQLQPVWLLDSPYFVLKHVETILLPAWIIYFISLNPQFQRFQLVCFTMFRNCFPLHPIKNPFVCGWNHHLVANQLHYKVPMKSHHDQCKSHLNPNYHKSPINGYGSKLGTPKLWMVNTKPDIHICGPLGLPFWPTSKWSINL